MVMAILPVLLVACGGAGSSSSTSTTSPKASGITLSGVVASGYPVINGGGYVLDASTGNTIPFTTNSSGNYSVSATGQGPFLLHVIGVNSGGSPVNMYSLATTGNANSTTNITPLTDIVLGYSSGVSTQSLESACTGNISACPALLNTIYGKLSAANTTFVAAVPAGLSFPSGYNVFTTPFTANHTGVDLVMDQIIVTPAGSGASSYIVSSISAPTTPVMTVPTTGTAGTQSTTSITTGTISTAQAAQAANLSSVLTTTTEIPKVFATLQSALNQATYPLLVTTLTPLIDVSFLDDGQSGATFLTQSGLGNEFPLGETVTGGAIAPYSSAPFTGVTPAPNATFDAGNCVTSVWVHIANHGVNLGSGMQGGIIKLIDTGYNPTTCLGGSWTIAGNQRNYKSTVLAESWSGAASRSGLHLHVPNTSTAASSRQPNPYTKAVIGGAGLVAYGDWQINGNNATPIPVTLTPADPNLNSDSYIQDPYYSSSTPNSYYAADGSTGIEGNSLLVSCTWVASHTSGWGAATPTTPCFNANAVAGSDYTVSFYNGATLVETHMERLQVTPPASVPASWFATITGVSPAGSTSPISVTVNWTKPTGSYSNAVLLNMNDSANGQTVNNTYYGPNINDVTATVTMGHYYGTPGTNTSYAFVQTVYNNMSLIAVAAF